MKIVGAGYAGLVAAHFFRHFDPIVIESSDGPVRNHAALLRLRSDSIARITGVTLHKVTVRKAVMATNYELLSECSLLAANSYAVKIATKIQDRSIHNLATVERWVPTENFDDELRRGIKVRYGETFTPDENNLGGAISTAPLHIWKSHFIGFDLFSVPITVVETILENVDVHQTVYQPWSSDALKSAEPAYFGAVYRFSIVGNRMLIEIVGSKNLSDEDALQLVKTCCTLLFGVLPDYSKPVCKVQQHGKLVPLAQSIRRKLIAEITARFGVYSLGRFATWRNLLLDDLPADLAIINGLIENGDYGARLHYASKEGIKP